MKNCVTHHYACDCREEAIRRAFEYILNEASENYSKVADTANNVLGELGFHAEVVIGAQSWENYIKVVRADAKYTRNREKDKGM